MTNVAPLDPEQLGRLVDQLPVLLWSTDLDLRLTSRRGGGLALLSPPPLPEDGLRVGEGVEDPAEAARAVAAHRAALGGSPTAYEVSFRGRTFSARVEPLRGADGAVAGVIGFAFDVTERARADAALRVSETRLRTIIESEPECVKLLAPDGTVLDMNPAGLAMIEAESLADIRGKSVTPIVAPEYRDAFDAVTRRTLAGEPGHLEFEIVGFRGTRRWMETRTVPLRELGGRITAVLGITRDITERRVAHDALLRSREQLRDLAARLDARLEAERSRISREIHDELGQVFTALKIDLAWLETKLPAAAAARLGARVKEMGRLIDTTLDAMHRIVSELRPGVLDDLGLPAAIQWLAGDFERRTGVPCYAEVGPGEVALADAQATAVFRIVQEALTNVARHAGASRVSIRLTTAPNALELVVADDGRGITEDEILASSSLGLLGMRERAAAWGGVVVVERTPARGTRVSLVLPLEPATQVSAAG